MRGAFLNWGIVRTWSQPSFTPFLILYGTLVFLPKEAHAQLSYPGAVLEMNITPTGISSFDAYEIRLDPRFGFLDVRHGPSNTPLFSPSTLTACSSSGSYRTADYDACVGGVVQGSGVETFTTRLDMDTGVQVLRITRSVSSSFWDGFSLRVSVRPSSALCSTGVVATAYASGIAQTSAAILGCNSAALQELASAPADLSIGRGETSENVGLTAITNQGAVAANGDVRLTCIDGPACASRLSWTETRAFPWAVQFVALDELSPSIGQRIININIDHGQDMMGADVSLVLPVRIIERQTQTLTINADRLQATALEVLTFRVTSAINGNGAHEPPLVERFFIDSTDPAITLDTSAWLINNADGSGARLVIPEEVIEGLNSGLKIRVRARARSIERNDVLSNVLEVNIAPLAIGECRVVAAAQNVEDPLSVQWDSRTGLVMLDSRNNPVPVLSWRVQGVGSIEQGAAGSAEATYTAPQGEGRASIIATPQDPLACGNAGATLEIRVQGGATLSLALQSSPMRGVVSGEPFAVRLNLSLQQSLRSLRVRLIFKGGSIPRQDLLGNDSVRLLRTTSGPELRGLWRTPVNAVELDFLAMARANIACGMGKLVAVLLGDDDRVLARDVLKFRVACEPALHESAVVGRVFIDRDGNGRYDADEDGLADTRVLISAGLSVVTDDEGRFYMSRLRAGFYAISVDPSTIPLGLKNTGALSRRLELSAGMTSLSNFPISVPEQEVKELVVDRSRSGLARTAAGLRYRVSFLPQTTGRVIGVVPALAQKNHEAELRTEPEALGGVPSADARHGGPWSVDLQVPEFKPSAFVSAGGSGFAAGRYLILLAEPSSVYVRAYVLELLRFRVGDGVVLSVSGNAAALVGELALPHRGQAVPVGPLRMRFDGLQKPAIPASALFIGADTGALGACAEGLCVVEVTERTRALLVRLRVNRALWGRTVPPFEFSWPIQTSNTRVHMAALSRLSIQCNGRRCAGDGTTSFYARGKLWGLSLRAGGDLRFRDPLSRAEIRSENIVGRFLWSGERWAYVDAEAAFEQGFEAMGFGDDSDLDDDRQGNGALFLRLRGERGFLQVGALDVERPAREVAAVSRRLRGIGGGAVFEFGEDTPAADISEADKQAPPKLKLSAYLAKGDTVPRNVQRLYTGAAVMDLNAPGMVEGSERIALVELDTVAGFVVRRRILQRGQDYRVDYLHGLLFLRPIAGVWGAGSIGDLVAPALATLRYRVEADFEQRTASAGLAGGWLAGASAVAKYGGQSLELHGLQNFGGAIGRNALSPTPTAFANDNGPNVSNLYSARMEVGNEIARFEMDVGTNLKENAPARWAADARLVTELDVANAYMYGTWVQPGYVDARQRGDQRILRAGMGTTLAPLQWHTKEAVEWRADFGARLDHAEQRRFTRLIGGIAPSESLQVYTQGIASAALRGKGFWADAETAFRIRSRLRQTASVAALRIGTEVSGFGITLRRRQPLHGSFGLGLTTLGISAGVDRENTQEPQAAGVVGEVGFMDNGDPVARIDLSSSEAGTYRYTGLSLGQQGAQGASIQAETFRDLSASPLGMGVRDGGGITLGSLRLQAEQGAGLSTRGALTQTQGMLLALPLGGGGQLTLAYEYQRGQVLAPGLTQLRVGRQETLRLGARFGGNESDSIAQALEGNIDIGLRRRLGSAGGKAQKPELGGRSRLEWRLNESARFGFSLAVKDGALNVVQNRQGTRVPDEASLQLQASMGFAWRGVRQVFLRYAIDRHQGEGMVRGMWRHVLSAIWLEPLWRATYVGGQATYRLSQAQVKRQGGGLTPAVDSAALLVGRVQVELSELWSIALPLDARVEGRLCAGENDSLGAAMSAGIMVLPHIRLGLGYNFSAIDSVGINCSSPGARGVTISASALY